MGSVRCAGVVVLSLAFLAAALTDCPLLAADRRLSPDEGDYLLGAQSSLRPSVPKTRRSADSRGQETVSLTIDEGYQVRLAFGRTFGTSTQLDYTTVEVNRPLRRYPTDTSYGLALGELRLAFLASHVSYREGVIERIKRLDFHDGYEVAVLPKWRLALAGGPVGLSTYLESGAGMSYVSETYRNSGSRWNWSLLAGLGMEKSLPGVTVFSLGLQWRHLSNGNMWGRGDELHNSNSGTDMVQGLLAIARAF